MRSVRLAAHVTLVYIARVPTFQEIEQDGRRRFLKLAGIGFIACRIEGVEKLLTPREAHAAGAPFTVLSDAEVATLEAFGDTLLPGAAEAGIAHFVDHHLSVDAPETLLMIRYLDIPPPYAPIYQLGLANLNRVASNDLGKPFAELAAEQRHELVGRIGRENPEGWQGPPSPLFYFIVRADAVDVVYGTEEGFAKLGVPYMAHIKPPSKW